MRKKIVLLALCAGVIMLAFGIKYLDDLREYKQITSSLAISNVDFSQLADGSYSGKFNAKFVAAETKVTVKDGKVVGIDLIKHKNGKGKSGEQVIQRVLTEQSLDVDAVSGATNSSKVILKSIENALKVTNINMK